MPDIFLNKTIYGLKPSDEEASEALKRFKIGDTIKAKISKPRNYRFHKKYFSLLKLVLENQEQYETLEQLLLAVKLKLKMYKVKLSIDGKPFPLVESINFASMDEIRFSKLYNDTINILSDFLGVCSEDLENEIIKFM